MGLKPGKTKNKYVVEMIHSGLKKSKKALMENDDSSIIDGLRDIKQCDIANYGSAFTYANEMGEREVAAWLKKTLEEEIRTIEKLAKIILSFKINNLHHIESTMSIN